MSQSKFKGIIWCLLLWGEAIPPFYCHWVMTGLHVTVLILLFCSAWQRGFYRLSCWLLHVRGLLQSTFLGFVISFVCIALLWRHVLHIYTSFELTTILLRNRGWLEKGCLCSFFWNKQKLYIIETINIETKAVDSSHEKYYCPFLSKINILAFYSIKVAIRYYMYYYWLQSH